LGVKRDNNVWLKAGKLPDVWSRASEAGSNSAGIFYPFVED